MKPTPLKRPHAFIILKTNPGKKLIFSGKRWLLATSLFIVLLLNVLPGYGQTSGPHGTTWYGVQPGEVKKIGDRIFLCWGWNGNDEIKFVLVQVYQVSGFIDNVNCVAPTGEKVFEKKVDCGSYGSSSRQICHDIFLCPRTGDFRVEFTVALKSNWKTSCPREQTTAIYPFTILLDAGIPTGLHSIPQIVCPNKPTKMKVSDTLAYQDGADWYKEPSCVPNDPTSHIPMKENSYSYDVEVADAQTKTMYPAYFKKYDQSLWMYHHDPDFSVEFGKVTCKAHGFRMPNTVIGAELNAIPPPAPIYRTVCGDDPVTFTIENPLSFYQGVYWYDQPSGSAPVHDGFTYTRSFPNAYTNLYIAYYKRLEGCEDAVSVIKSPVAVINMREVTKAAFLNGVAKPLLENMKITDYRDVSDSLTCSEPGEEGHYWINLESDALTQLQTDMQEALNGVIEGLDLPTGIVDVKASLGRVMWYAYNAATDQWDTEGIYLEQDGKKVVCSDYICAEGESKSRLYQKRASLIIRYSYTDSTGAVVPASDLVCGERLLASYNIQSVHPQQTPTTLCENLDLVALREYASMDKILDGCNGYQLFSACPATQYTIGPTTAEVRAMFAATGGTDPLGLFSNPATAHRWTPATGLSNANIQNPRVWHSDMVPYTGNFVKYTNNITFINGNHANYCTVIYRCDNCGPIDKKPTADGLLDDM